MNRPVLLLLLLLLASLAACEAGRICIPSCEVLRTYTLSDDVLQTLPAVDVGQPWRRVFAQNLRPGDLVHVWVAEIHGDHPFTLENVELRAAATVLDIPVEPVQTPGVATRCLQWQFRVPDDYAETEFVVWFEGTCLPFGDAQQLVLPPNVQCNCSALEPPLDELHLGTCFLQGARLCQRGDRLIDCDQPVGL